MSFEIRQMTRADLDVALGWAREEGWNPGLDDAGPFYAADPSGFLMGWLGPQRVGCISVVKSGARFAFLGLYIVVPAHRGQGYGKRLWDAGIASAGGRDIGLDGVPAQQENYRKSGFSFAHRSARWGGTPSGLVPRRGNVRPLTAADLPAVAAFDRLYVAAPRDAFLAAWLAPSASRLAEGQFEDGRLRGYGVIRRCVSGFKIGPLFAETPAIAESLLASLISSAGADQVFIDVPEPNLDGVALARRTGLAPAFETARMYLGAPPALPLQRIFGITTLELG